MEELHELLGWLSVALLVSITFLGFALKYSDLKDLRKHASYLHRLFAILLVLTVTFHYISAEESSRNLILFTSALILLVPLSFIAFKLKLARYMIRVKMIILPLLVIGLLLGHFGIDEKEHGEHHEKSEKHEKD